MLRHMRRVYRRRSARGLREDADLVVAQDLVGRSGALLRAALHVALEVDRTVLPGEVTPAVGVRLARPLIAAELRVLSYLPEGVGAEQVGVAERVVEGRGPVEGRRDAGKDLLQVLKRVLGVGG